MNEPIKMYTLEWIRTSEDYGTTWYITEDERLAVWKSREKAEAFVEQLANEEYNAGLAMYERAKVKAEAVTAAKEAAKAALEAAGMDSSNLLFHSVRRPVLPVWTVRYKVVEVEVR